jgi:hypothetical protein
MLLDTTSTSMNVVCEACLRPKGINEVDGTKGGTVRNGDLATKPTAIIMQPTTFRHFDLRGNDLSTLRGAANLSGAVITREQRQQLAEALVAELDLTYAADEQP